MMKLLLKEMKLLVLEKYGKKKKKMFYLKNDF